MLFYDICLLVIVGALWGITNPLIRRGSVGVNALPDTGSTFRNILQEIRMVGQRLSFWVPFALNQSGGLLFILCVQKAGLSIAAPIANSLTFLFTALSGYYLGEEIPKKGVLIGTLFILMGTSLMLYDQQYLNRQMREPTVE